MTTHVPGARLGPYELIIRVGAGGMGEVWKARDTRLDRVVAIKFSTTEFGEHFEREARAISALNHPHICHLYDVSPDYLVMEFVDGKPLTGPLPLAKALHYAGQILDALHAAHAQGIVHGGSPSTNATRNRQRRRPIGDYSSDRKKTRAMLNTRLRN